MNKQASQASRVIHFHVAHLLKQNMARQRSVIEIAAVVAAYFVISIVLVFSNKILMTKGTAIEAPLFVTWFQCVLSAFIIQSLGLVGKRSANNSSLKEFTSQSFEIKKAQKILPLSVIFVGMITLNNLCLMYVTVAFYNVARSLTIVFNVIFTFMLLGEKTSSATLACLAVVIVGFFIGADGEIEFSLLGTIFGVLSSAFVSLNSIFTKRLSPVVDDDKWRLAFYNNVNAALIFLPLIFISGEHYVLIANLDILFSGRYWALMLFAGVLGFAIGIVTVMQINYTSPLSHNISGTAKACIQSILALIIWQTPFTVNGIIGLFLTIFGSLLYARVRLNEAQQAGKIAPIPKEFAYLPVETKDNILNASNESVTPALTKV